MSRKIIGLISVSVLILSSLAVLDRGKGSPSSPVHYSGLPKVDEILFKAYPGAPPEFVVDEFLAGATDWIDGPYRTDLYNRVSNASANPYGAAHKISQMSPQPEFSFIMINCRDYKETSGEPNHPLNDSNFRIALSHIYGMDRKQDHINNYHSALWEYAIDNPVPEAQKPWHNESILMPDTNWTKAWSILQTAGYYINSTENWLHYNGVRVRNMTMIHSGPPPGHYARKVLVEAFNEFVLTHLSANGPTIESRPVSGMDWINQLMRIRDFDFVVVGLTNLGSNVDWLYDLLHSNNDVYEGWNFAGIHDPDFDRWTETILTNLDTQEVIDAASKVQEKFVYELLPWIPVTSGKDFCTTANDTRGELMNVVSTPNFGPFYDWSFMTIHWKGEPDTTWPGGTVKVALGDDLHTLNPWTDDHPYSWQIMDRAISGLTRVEPENLINMPFIATNWEISFLPGRPEYSIINGCRVTFWLRQDVTWHDGKPVTAYDCVENLRFLREHQPGLYSDIWADLMYEEADGPYKFSAYFNKSSLRYIDDVAN
ncbi:MAG: ABC transporter substrate-binding protein, partial [Candidatus Bathyarchaeota archaeon]